MICDAFYKEVEFRFNPDPAELLARRITELRRIKESRVHSYPERVEAIAELIYLEKILKNSW